ncbi:hypothetical protein IWW55_005003, partial [Coemansia sp. RSA 2706]
YTDANFYHNSADHVNIAYLFKMAGGVVLWHTKKVKSAVPQSTAEAELYALNAGVCDLVWLRNFLGELDLS